MLGTQYGAEKPVAMANLSGAAGAINTTGYTQLVASTPQGSCALQIINTTGSLIKLAIGAAAAEVDIPFMSPSGEVTPIVRVDIKKGVRISARAVDTNSTGGQLAVNFLG